jgi:glycosyltransferase involved in cell wall biosynthesis
MKFSLITTLYNEGDNILNFLDSYKNQTKYADEFIIVDGGSIDGTIDIINNYANKYKDLNLRLIVDKTCSKKHIAGPVAKGRNVAIENSNFDYIAVTDAGCILDKNWFEEIVKPFEDNSVDVVAGWYEANITNNFQKEYANIAMPKLETVDRKNFLPSSRSIAFKKSCWKKVRMYPTMTYTAEDTLFDVKLKTEGFKFYFAEKAFVYWDCPFDLEDAKKKHFSYGYGDGQLRLFKKEFIIGLIKLILPIQIFKNMPYLDKMFMKYILLYSNHKGYLKGYLNGLDTIK